jgi:hypothetical protein
MAKLCVSGMEATTPPAWNCSSKFDGRSGHSTSLLMMIRPIRWGIWNVKGSYWKPHSFPGARLTGGGRHARCNDTVPCSCGRVTAADLLPESYGRPPDPVAS